MIAIVLIQLQARWAAIPRTGNASRACCGWTMAETSCTQVGPICRCCRRECPRSASPGLQKPKNMQAQAKWAVVPSFKRELRPRLFWLCDKAGTNCRKSFEFVATFDRCHLSASSASPARPCSEHNLMGHKGLWQRVCQDRPRAPLPHSGGQGHISSA